LYIGSGLFLFNSKLCWILGGQTENTDTEQSSESHLLVGTIGTAIVDDRSNALNYTNILSASKPNLEPFWSLEAIGITDSPKLCEDDKTLESF